MNLSPAPTTQDTAPASAGGGSDLELLTAIHDARAAEEHAARQVWIGIATWCERHTTGALMPEVHSTYGLLDLDAVTAWQDRYGMPGADEFLDLAGAGAPAVSDFAVTELTTLLGRTLTSGRLLVGDVLETQHRLPTIWARLVAGQVTTWRAARIARETRTLTPEAAAFVDAHLAHVAHSAGLPTITRLVAEAAARFDPETTEAEESDTRAGLHVHLALADTATSIGTASAVTLDALLDRADAEELETALQGLAAQLAADGSTETLDVRRARALGILARGQHPLPTTHHKPSHPARRQVVLHVHLTDTALHGTPEVDPGTGRLGIHLARLENHRHTLTADTVREWCATPGTQVTVKPIIDLTETIAVDSYEIPDRIAHRVRLTRATCVFPHCTRPARATDHDPTGTPRANADLDHTTEYRPPDEGGPPGQTSTGTLAPLCRTHHRAKTHPSPLPTAVLDHARWHYQRLTPGTWTWTSPHGHHYLVHPDGTTQL